MTSLSEILDSIEKRAERATSGPWDNHLCVNIPVHERYETGPTGYVVTENLTHQSYYQRYLNRSFCGHARTDVPRLVRALEECLYYFGGVSVGDDENNETINERVTKILQGEESKGE